MSKYQPLNIVRDFNKNQGMTHPTDSSYQILRDLSTRYVSIENSSQNPVSIAISRRIGGETPPSNFTLQGGETKALSINEKGIGAQQFIWLLDPTTKKPIGHNTVLSDYANTFVIREGVDLWWVQLYRTPSFSAQK